MRNIQHCGESLNAQHSCLRQLASTCEFADINKEIKSQIIQSCSSQCLHREAIRDAMMTLDTLLDEARAPKVSKKQAKDIESFFSANSVLPESPETPQEKRFSYYCSESWPKSEERLSCVKS